MSQPNPRHAHAPEPPSPHELVVLQGDLGLREEKRQERPRGAAGPENDECAPTWPAVSVDGKHGVERSARKKQSQNREESERDAR